jgi:hypothetical protein
MEAVLQPLGQQELEPPAPGRVIRAPRDATWWGCDPSTKRLSIGWVKADGGRGVATRSFGRDWSDDGARLDHFHAEVRAFAVELVAEGGHPGFIWLEQPFGKQVPPISHMAVGAIGAALHGALGCPVELVGAPTWKVAALGPGFGTCSKKDPAGYPVARWARTMGYRGVLEDEMDALAIAVAASRSVGFAAT